MWCPRIKHFVRLNPTGRVSRCGHMVAPPQFDSIEEMNDSEWQRNLEHSFMNGTFPPDCIRCQQTEQINKTSIRLNAVKFDALQQKKDYLCVGGVLDNICNSGCQTCNPNCSTKIGSLYGKEYLIVDNTNKFWQLPQDRITHFDINGGEPSASKNYKQVLANLPANVQSIRINTNCSIVMPELQSIIDRGVQVTVTISLDGIDEYHNYLRWPIKWDKFYNNLMTYKSMGLHDLNLWTTVSALNVCNLTEIFNFVKKYEFNHSYALLHSPDVLSVKYKNGLTLKARDKLGDHPVTEHIAVGEDNSDALEHHLAEQNALRGINIEREYTKVYYGE